MTEMVINSQESLQTAIGNLRAMWGESKFLRLKIRRGKDRSINFNDLSHVWYEQIARELREDDALGYKAFCKLHFAVPILRAEDSEFRSFYDGAIRQGFSYEQKLAAMRYLPVSSLMTNPQFKQYCEAMQAHFLTQGVQLNFPTESQP